MEIASISYDGILTNFLYYCQLNQIITHKKQAMKVISLLLFFFFNKLCTLSPKTEMDIRKRSPHNTVGYLVPRSLIEKHLKTRVTQ